MRSRSRLRVPPDIILILGAPVLADGSPSPILEGRLRVALDAHRMHGAPILCCGGSRRPGPQSEAEVMCAWLRAKGVPGECILLENASEDTLENILYAQDILRDNGFVRPLIATSRYHWPRVYAICRRHGLRARCVLSPTPFGALLKAQLREIPAWGQFFLTWFTQRRS